MQFDQLKRRELITLLGGAASWRLAAHAQQPAMPMIGFLNGQSEAQYKPIVEAFHRGLGEAGYVEGQNVMILFRWADDQFDRLPMLANDLVQHNVAVLVLTGGSSHLAKVMTTTIPILCTVGGDPVQLGLAVSLNRPGGNITGMSVFTSDLEAKRLELMHELVPKTTLIGVLLDSKFQSAADLQSAELQAAARKLGREIRIVHASTENAIDGAFAALLDMRAGALVVTGSPVFLNWRDRLLALTARHGLPAIYENSSAPPFTNSTNFFPKPHLKG
jgi:putative ABC transport system substrate-binding protein